MEIELRMTRQDIFIYSVYNSNSGAKGIFNACWTIGWLAAFVRAWSTGTPPWQECAAMVFCILLFSAIQPAILWNKSGKQAKKDTFSLPLYLTLSEKGIRVARDSEKAEIEWERIRKVVRVRHLFILDMGFGRAYLVSRQAVRGREQEFVDFCKQVLPPTKTKGLKA